MSLWKDVGISHRLHGEQETTSPRKWLQEWTGKRLETEQAAPLPSLSALPLAPAPLLDGLHRQAFLLICTRPALCCHKMPPSVPKFTSNLSTSNFTACFTFLIPVSLERAFDSGSRGGQFSGEARQLRKSPQVSAALQGPLVLLSCVWTL